MERLCGCAFNRGAQWNPLNIRVLSVRCEGSVVDAVFEDATPPMRSVLRAGPDGGVVIEVTDHIRFGEVRCIALKPTAGLARGDPVIGEGMPLTAPVGIR